MAPGSPTHRPSDLRDRFFVPSLSACCFLFLSCSPLASFTPLFFSFGSFSLPNSLSVPEKPLFLLLLLAACGGKEKKKEKLGTLVSLLPPPQTPAGRPLHPFYDGFKWYSPPAAARHK